MYVAFILHILTSTCIQLSVTKRKLPFKEAAFANTKKTTQIKRSVLHSSKDIGSLEVNPG